MKGVEYKKELVKQWPVFVQPKLDGIRMLSYEEKGKVITQSYQGNSFETIEHIKEELQEFFQWLPTGSILDGELYNHDFDFTDIVSAVKRVKTFNEKVLEIKYWIFDVAYEPNEPYEKRYTVLVNAFTRYCEDKLEESGTIPSNLVIVQAEAAYSDKEIRKYNDQYLEEGYEGTMVKKLGLDADENTKEYKESLYKYGRSNNIMKFKPFQDEEGIVIGITESKGTEKGLAIPIVMDKRGNKFNVRMKGEFAKRKKWFQHPETIIGKELTYRFQELSTYGVPRHPRGIAIRDYE